LVETMKDVVLHYLCPRLDPSQGEDVSKVPQGFLFPTDLLPGGL
jgi:hypothetical protein